MAGLNCVVCHQFSTVILLFSHEIPWKYKLTLSHQ